MARACDGDRLVRVAAATVLLAAASTACGDSPVPDAPVPPLAVPSAAPAAPAGGDAGPYCATVTRVQHEQGGAGGGNVAAAAQGARRQVADLAAVAPPEIAGDWRALQALTDQAVAGLGAPSGDPNRIDRGALVRLQAQAQPAIQHIQDVTDARCHVTFRPPA